MVGHRLGLSAALASAVLLSAPAAQAQDLGDILGTIVEGMVSQQLPQGQQADAQERALWDAAQRRNTVAAYRSYLDDYPNGAFAATARARVAAAAGSGGGQSQRGTTTAQQVEANLRLTSTERRQVQRDLNLFGYDTNGTDGVFGQGTRRAIRNYQSNNNFVATGYITGEQINTLRRQADEERARRGNGGTTATPDNTSSSARTELALNLSRNDRTRIQQQLTNLGYDTNGVDGLFGSGTRSAIGRWQQANNLSRTGYLNASQLASLRNQAGTPTTPSPGNDDVEEQLLSLTRAERIEAQRLLTSLGYDTRGVDGVFGSGTRNAIGRWQGANGWPATGYLNADQFRALRQQGSTRTETSRADEQAWQRATTAKTLAGYQDYLDAHPNGAHAAEARRIVDRTSAELAQAESALLPEASVRRLVEQRLSELGFNPGTVDGTFTSTTRGAIRDYQRRNGLTVTGYAGQQTLMRMLGDI